MPFSHVGIEWAKDGGELINIKSLSIYPQENYREALLL